MPRAVETCCTCARQASRDEIVRAGARATFRGGQRSRNNYTLEGEPGNRGYYLYVHSDDRDVFLKSAITGTLK